MRPITAVFGMLLASAPLSGCDQGASFRYRMTVEVDTPQGLRTGSAVHEIDAHHNTWFVNSAVRGRRLRGEAVAVELPGGRTLFVLTMPGEERFRPSGFPDIILRTLDPAYVTDWVESVGRVRSRQGTRTFGVIAPVFSYPSGGANAADRQPSYSNYPLMVTFRNPRVPASVVRVDPRNLASELGAGIHLRRITVQVTDDRVTNDLGRRQPWLMNYRSSHLNGSSSSINDATDSSPAANLSGWSFSTELTDE